MDTELVVGGVIHQLTGSGIETQRLSAHKKGLTIGTGRRRHIEWDKIGSDA
jgi:hypothetical protein